MSIPGLASSGPAWDSTVRRFITLDDPAWFESTLEAFIKQRAMGLHAGRKRAVA